MLYMNRHEVADALVRYGAHPILGPATGTLASLVDAVDACSDGWAHWPAPVRAARQLMQLIGSTREYLEDRARADVTEAQLHRAYTPLRAFRARQHVAFRIYTVDEWPAVPSAAAASQEALHAAR